MAAIDSGRIVASRTRALNVRANCGGRPPGHREGKRRKRRARGPSRPRRGYQTRGAGARHGWHHAPGGGEPEKEQGTFRIAARHPHDGTTPVTRRSAGGGCFQFQVRFHG
jgi:hypothetical protein